MAREDPLSLMGADQAVATTAAVYARKSVIATVGRCRRGGRRLGWSRGEPASLARRGPWRKAERSERGGAAGVGPKVMGTLSGFPYQRPYRVG